MTHQVTMILSVPVTVMVDAKDDDDAIVAAFDRLEKEGLDAGFVGGHSIRPNDFDSALVQELGNECDEPEHDKDYYEHENGGYDE